MRTVNKKIVTILLAAIMQASLIPSIASAEDTVDYAEIIFGNVPQYTNMNERYANYMVAATEQGRTGTKSVKDAGGDSMWLDINDNFMFDLPEDTPVDITVEYFDKGNGHFNIHYDSHNPDKEWSGLASNDVYKETEIVHLENTNEWKSHTFHIEDMRAANRIYGGDLRLSVWSPTLRNSKEDVLWGSIKITYGEYLNPLKAEVGLGNPGNLMNENDETEICINAKNKDPKDDISFTVKGDIYDSYDRLIQTVEPMTFNMEPLETNEYKVPINNPKKYDIYRFVGTTEIDYKSKGTKLEEPLNIKFSVSHTFEPGTGNTEYGACHQIMSYGMGDPEDVASVYNKAGLTYLRDDLNKNVFERDGDNWIVKQSCIDGWRTLKEQGVKVIGILFGGDESGIPTNEEQLVKWEKWLTDTVTQCKDVIDVFEVWNEPNITAFNKGGATPEHYAETLKRSYTIIKRIAPESTVIGLGTAAMDGLNIDYEFTKRVFEAGAADSMDALSIHPYDWSGSFRDKLWIESAEKLHELMKEYGIEDKEVWITEFGFSTFEGLRAFTRQEQYQNFALSRSMAKSYGLYDKYIFYCFADRARRDNLEENWGIVDWYAASENPYAAKESFLGTTAFNYFINQNADVKDVVEEDSVYSFHYYNNDLKKDVLHLQSHNTEINMSGGCKKNYKLGCSSIDVYDAFGNRINTVYSDNGEYSFVLTDEPIYVTGNFTEFEVTEYAPFVAPERIEINGSGGDIVSLKLKKHTDKNLTLQVEDVVEVVENNGFIGDEAEIKIRVPNKISTQCRFEVSAVDSEGKAYYGAEHVLNITTPISITITSEPASDLNNNQWRVKAVVKNLCVSRDISGIYRLTGPEDLVSMNTERKFNLNPQEEVVYYFMLPEKVSKNVIDLKSVAELDDGYAEENETKLNFTTAVYAKNKPVIDGVISDNEWIGSWVGADKASDVKEIENWGGPSDVSFSGSLMWDEDNLYFLGIATDDVNYIQHGDDPWNMWSTDSFQFAVDDRKFINPIESSKFNELGIGEVPSGGAVVYRYSSYYDGQPVGVIENCEVAVKRYAGYRVYEVSLPWDEIFYKDYVVDEEEIEKSYSFSVMLNDNDGDGRGWIEYMGGIGNPKDAQLFGRMNLKK